MRIADDVRWRDGTRRTHVAPFDASRTDQPARSLSRRSRLRGHHLFDRVCDLIGIVGVDEPSGVAEEFWKRATIRGDDRYAKRHRFEYGETEPLLERGLHEQTRTFV
jgi:hypothetical protein